MFRQNWEQEKTLIEAVPTYQARFPEKFCRPEDFVIMNQKINRQVMDTRSRAAGPNRFDFHAAFAASFHDWRLRNNLTLKEVAMDLGLSISTVNCWELGQRFPSGRHLELLIQYTGLPPCRLFCVRQDDCQISEECVPSVGAKKSSIEPSARPATSTLSRI